MYKIILLIATILLASTGCKDNSQNLENKIDNLQKQIAIKDSQIDKYKGLKNEVEELKRKCDQVEELSFPIIQELKRLDQDIYGGKFVQHLHENGAKPEEIVNGYIALINHIREEHN